MEEITISAGESAKVEDPPIHAIIDKLDEHALALEIKKGTDPHSGRCPAVHARNSKGRTPLMSVALKVKDPSKCAAMVEELINAGAEPMDVDWRAGRTALHWACEVNNLAFYDALHKKVPDRVWPYYRDFGAKPAYAILREKQFAQFLTQVETDLLRKSVPVQENEKLRLAVVGVGAAGAAFFIRLVKRLKMYGDTLKHVASSVTKEHSIDPMTQQVSIVYTSSIGGINLAQGLEIFLLDRNHDLGMGTPYSPEKNAPTSLLNIAAGGMSIDPDSPLDFVLWLKEREVNDQLSKDLGDAFTQGLCPASARIDGYYPRLLFGTYVNDRLSQWIETAKSMGISVEVANNFEVVKHEPQHDGSITLSIKDVDTGNVQDAKPRNFSHVFYSTGHWDEKEGTKSTWKKDPRACVFPVNRENFRANWVQKLKLDGKPLSVGMIGGALSAIDAINTVLLDPRVGHLEWDGDEPTYVQTSPHRVSVTCYTRRGLFSRVRPQTNKDLDLAFLSPQFVTELTTIGNVSLKQTLELLEEELNYHFPKRKGKVTLDDDISPFDSLEYAKKTKDPFAYLMEDLDIATGGDQSDLDNDYAKWYQVIHSLFPICRLLYRQFTPADKKLFDEKYNSNFLWAFAPMPDRSAKVLLAMHKAGFLEHYRVSANPNGDVEPVIDGNAVHIWHVDYEGVPVKAPAVHDVVIATPGLQSIFNNDASELTQQLIQAGHVTFGDPLYPAAIYPIVDPKSGKTAGSGQNTANIFMTDDGTFRLLTGTGAVSPRVFGVGFFLHAQLWDVQSVPTVTRYASQAAEVVLDDFIRSREIVRSWKNPALKEIHLPSAKK